MLEEEEGISQAPLRVSQLGCVRHSCGQPGWLLTLKDQGHHRQCRRGDGPHSPHLPSPTVQVLPLAFHPALLLPSDPALAPGLGPAKSILPMWHLRPATTVTSEGYRPRKGEGEGSGSVLDGTKGFGRSHHCKERAPELSEAARHRTPTPC